MASRRKGRILAFQALYSWDLHYSSPRKAPVPEELLEFSWAGSASSSESSSSLKEETRIFSALIVSGTIENISLIDKEIQKHLRGWEIDRINRVDLAILRMSVYTLLFQKEIAPSIIIDEAIGISKEFGTDDSYRFINGVLDNVRKSFAE